MVVATAGHPHRGVRVERRAKADRPRLVSSQLASPHTSSTSLRLSPPGAA